MHLILYLYSTVLVELILDRKICDATFFLMQNPQFLLLGLMIKASANSFFRQKINLNMQLVYEVGF